MIEKYGRIDNPSIHLASASSRLISTCLLAGNARADITGQTQEILDEITDHLSRFGSGREKLLMVQVWLADIRDLPAFAAVWNHWILSDHPPALSVVEAAAAHPDLRVEIRAWATR